MIDARNRIPITDKLQCYKKAKNNEKKSRMEVRIDGNIGKAKRNEEDILLK